MYMMLTGGTDGAAFEPETQDLTGLDTEDTRKLVAKRLFDHLNFVIGDFEPGTKVDRCMNALAIASPFFDQECAWVCSEPASTGTVAFWVCVALVKDC